MLPKNSGGEPQIPRKVRQYTSGHLSSAIEQPPFWMIFQFLMIVRFGLDRSMSVFTLSFGSFSATLGLFFNLIFVGMAFSLVIVMYNRRSTSPRWINLSIVLWSPFVLSNFLSLFHGGQFNSSIKSFWNLITFFSAFALGMFYGQTRSLKQFSFVIVLAGIIPVLISPIFGLFDGLGSRLQGVTTHPNILAFFLFFYVSFCYHGILWGWIRHTRQRAIAICFSVIATGELLLTGTRSAFVALYVFIIASTLRRPVFLAFVIPAPLIALAVPSVYDRITEVTQARPISYEYATAVARGDIDTDENINADSGTWRVFLWKAAWPVIIRSPIIGHGSETFISDSPSFFSLGFGTGVGAHNIYIQILYEQGFIGLFCYLWLVFGTLFVAVVNFRRAPGIALFIIVLDVSFNVASFSDNMLDYLVDQIYIWSAIGFALSSLAHPSMRRPIPPPSTLRRRFT